MKAHIERPAAPIFRIYSPRGLFDHEPSVKGTVETERKAFGARMGIPFFEIFNAFFECCPSIFVPTTAPKTGRQHKLFTSAESKPARGDFPVCLDPLEEAQLAFQKILVSRPDRVINDRIPLYTPLPNMNWSP